MRSAARWALLSAVTSSTFRSNMPWSGGPPSASRSLPDCSSSASAARRRRANWQGLHRRWAEPRKAFLAIVRKVGVGRRRCTRGIEAFHLVGVEQPADRTEIVLELRFVARADDHRGNRWALQQPVDRDLWHG